AEPALRSGTADVVIGEGRVRYGAADGRHVASQAVVAGVDGADDAPGALGEGRRAGATARGRRRRPSLVSVAGAAARFIRARRTVAGIAVGRVAGETAEGLAAFGVALAPGQGRRLEPNGQRGVVDGDEAAPGAVALGAEGHHAGLRRGLEP